MKYAWPYIETDESGASSLVPESTLFSGPAMPTPCSSGASSSTTAGSKASTAPSFATRPPSATDPQTLSDRLTPLLISAGLGEALHIRPCGSSQEPQSGLLLYGRWMEEMRSNQKRPIDF